MRKLVIAGGAFLALLVGAGMLYLLFGPAYRLAEPLTAPGKEPDPFALFLPTAWAVADSKEETLGKIHLPFLREKLVGKRVKVATIKGEGVVFTSPKSTYKNTLLTDGKLTVLAESGQLLRIELYPAKDIGPLPGQMCIEEAEERYRSTSEKYEALPEAKSALSFQDILNRLYSDAGDEIEKSKRIEVVYVIALRSSGGIRKAEPMWAVNCFGFPPYPAVGFAFGTVSDEERSHLRYRLDAKGNVLGADNQP